MKKAIRERLARVPGGGNWRHFFFLAMSHHRRDRPGDKTKSLTYYKQAVQWYEDESNPSATTTAQYKTFLAEADAVLGTPARD